MGCTGLAVIVAIALSCDKEIAVAIAPCEQSFTAYSHVDTVHDVKTPDADAAVH